jgi:uncharacterized protein YhfF
MSSRGPVSEFWQECLAALAGLPHAEPEAWAFGASPPQADELLALVLAGKKTGTASSLRDYAIDGDPVPAVGDLSIVLDGRGAPRALIRTTVVDIVLFRDVAADHALAEGEGDLSLEWWRGAHARFWTEHSSDPRGFEPDMPVVCERFELLHPSGDTIGRAPGGRAV